jgi:asparagine synthase (glutamine-hydrolysing)
MHSFFAMGWNPHSDPANAEADKLIRRILRDTGLDNASLSASGLAIFDLGKNQHIDPVVPISHGVEVRAGAVIGTLYRKSSRETLDPRVDSISGEEADRLFASNGSEILSSYWGSYVLVLNIPGGLCLIADAMSSVPCFYFSCGGISMAFSNLEACTFLDRSGLTINYDFISALLSYDKIQNGQTGISEIRELQAGERVLIAGDKIQTQKVWDPRLFAADPLEGSRREQAARLKEVTRRSIRSRASSYQSITVNTSGGLDSAIVLSCLAKAPRLSEIRALHHVLVSGDVGEEAYAREVCHYVNTHLQITKLQPSAGLPSVEAHPLSARPCRDFTAGNAGEVFDSWNPSRSDAIFTGQGGDHLFLASESPLGFVDYLMSSADRSGWAEQLMSAARLSNQSIWSVLLQAPIALGRGRRSSMLQAFEARCKLGHLLGTPVVDAKELLPDWTRDANGLPPAKFDQVSTLSHLIHVRDSLDRAGGIDIVHPLMSQPVLEHCLRLPTYDLCCGGISRGLARLAFQGDIPNSIRTRMTKGHAGLYFSSSLESNSAAIYDSLVNGRLVEKGLLDPQKVGTFMSSGLYLTTESGNRLLVIYAIEAWLRRWLDIIGQKRGG